MVNNATESHDSLQDSVTQFKNYRPDKLIAFSLLPLCLMGTMPALISS